MLMPWTGATWWASHWCTSGAGNRRRHVWYVLLVIQVRSCDRWRGDGHGGGPLRAGGPRLLRRGDRQRTRAGRHPGGRAARLQPQGGRQAARPGRPRPGAGLHHVRCHGEVVRREPPNGPGPRPEGRGHHLQGGEMSAVVCEDVVKQYQDVSAVDGVSFEIHEGEIFGMIGPNGAGKTTLMECIEGLRHHYSGRIDVLGHDPAKASATPKERIGIQLQASSLLPRIKVRETFDLFASFYPRPVDTGVLLDRMGLTEKAGSYVAM